MLQTSKPGSRGFRHTISSDFKRNRMLYLLFLPVLAFYIIFAYWPMYGTIIALKDYAPGMGIGGSPWANPALKHFIRFVQSPLFFRVVRNTFVLSAYSLIFSFPAPIILALLLNEVRHDRFKKAAQTLTYLPHFISLVVICGMISDFSSSQGLFNDIAVSLGGERSALLQQQSFFRPMYIISEIWQEVGWGSIIYLAALSNIDEQLYEAAKIDGASRLQQLKAVTLPGIMPTIVIMLILRVGSLLGVGYEKVILLYNPATYEVSDVISSYVYRSGLQDGNWSYSAAIGLLNSLVNFIFLIAANTISRRAGETSLW
jgi:putative aldouronate transport system permease protein